MIEETIFSLRSLDLLITLYGIRLGLVESQYLGGFLVRNVLVALVFNAIFSLALGFVYRNCESELVRRIIRFYAISIVFIIFNNFILVFN